MRRAILILLAMSSVPVLAGDTSTELTLFGGYRGGGELYARNLDFVDTNLEVDGAAAFGLNLGIPLNSRWSLEFLVDHQATELRYGDKQFEPGAYFADFDVTYYQLGARFQWITAGSRPFITFGLGIVSMDIDLPGARREDEFSARVGGGVLLPISEKAGVRIEGRGFWGATGSSNWDWDDCGRDCRYRYENDDLWQGELSVGLVLAF